MLTLSQLQVRGPRENTGSTTEQAIGMKMAVDASSGEIHYQSSAL